MTLLAWIGLLEGYPPEPATIDELAARTGYGPAAFRTLALHAELDAYDPALSAKPSIVVGAKADLLFFDAASTWLTPLRDPIKNVVYSAQASDVHTVMVNGKVVLRDRRVLNVDEAVVNRALQEAGERMWPRMNGVDWGKRRADELSPMSYPAWTE